MNKLKSILLCIPLIVLGGISAPSAKSDTGQDYGGQSPNGTVCTQDVQHSWITLTSSTGVRQHKIGVAMSPTCKTAWVIAEAPVDSVAALENDSNSIISGSKVRVSFAGRYGHGRMVEYSGQVRACIVVPFGRKKCTDYKATPF